MPFPGLWRHHIIETMNDYMAEQTLDQEETAQGRDLQRAPERDQLLDQARDQAEASGWISEDAISWPTADTRDGVINRRQELHDTMRRLEAAAARPSGLADWRIEIEAALAKLEAALRSHVRQLEADDGLFAQVMDQSPHLASEMDSLRSEHEQLLTACHAALSRSADWATSKLRRRINILLGRLATHRQEGAELLYHAYNVDIGGSN